MIRKFIYFKLKVISCPTKFFFVFVQMVFIVRNKGMEKKLGFIYIPKYTRAMVKLLQWRQ